MTIVSKTTVPGCDYKDTSSAVTLLVSTGMSRFDPMTLVQKHPQQGGSRAISTLRMGKLSRLESCLVNVSPGIRQISFVIKVDGTEQTALSSCLLFLYCPTLSQLLETVDKQYHNLHNSVTSNRSTCDWSETW